MGMRAECSYHLLATYMVDRMSKTWSTKKKIISLLSNKQYNMTEISQLLGVAPSTVSQHLSELKSMGAITEIENSHIRKWKYYRSNPEFDFNRFISGESMVVMQRVAFAIIALVAVGALAYYLTSSSRMAFLSAAPSSGMIFSLTDPPQVPQGTNALFIGYSSLEARINSSSGTEWINSDGKGTLNLMGLVNVSQVIGSANVPTNTMISAVRFRITNATIVVNGTSYNVTLPNSVVTANITSGNRINGLSKTLIDMSPTVAEIYTNNATIFVLVPSVKAVVIPQESESSNATLGAQVKLNETEDNALSHDQAGINVTSESLSMANNRTSFSVTVKNLGNSSETIKHVTLLGNLSVLIAAQQMAFNAPYASSHSDRPSALSEDLALNTGITANAGGISIGVGGSTGTSGASDAASVGTTGTSSTTASNTTSTGSGSGLSVGIDTGKANLSVFTGMKAENNGGAEGIGGSVEVKVGGSGPPLVEVNSSDINGLGIDINSTVEDELRVGINAERTGSLTFVVSSNGQLVLPSTGADFEGNGFTLAPGASETFTFNGTLVTGDGHLRLTPVAGDAYRVVVQGENGVSASSNVTAG